MRQTEVFDRVLQLVNALHGQHRHKPQNRRRPAVRPQRSAGDERITGKM